MLVTNKLFGLAFKSFRNIKSHLLTKWKQKKIGFYPIFFCLEQALIKVAEIPYYGATLIQQ